MSATGGSGARGAIELRDAACGYGPGAFRLVVPELAARPGERIALIGPSGCGKSTLVQLLAGILPVESGSVRVDGAELAALSEPARRRFRLQRIGLVFQDLELVDYLSALDNVLLPLRLAPGSRVTPEHVERARELARRLDIERLLDRLPGELSGGERQRVAVCRALVTEPAICLADEPTGHLDQRNAEAVLDLFVEEVARRGTTLVLVTHDHRHLDRFDRVLDGGEAFASAKGASR
ncbi:MAG: ABC transporter ATP-binding protein [Planctomycetota bacterium]